MTRSALILGAILLAGAAFAAALLWRRRSRQRALEAFQSLAARRGWSLMMSGQALGRPAITRLSARSGSSWQVETRLHEPANHSGPPILTTDYTAQEPNWPDGVLLLGPSLPPAVAAQARDSVDLPNSAIGQRLLRQMVGDDMADSFTAQHGRLALFDALPGLTVLASADPTRRVDLRDMAATLAEWRALRPLEKAPPVVILGPDGLCIRLPHGPAPAERMEWLVDLAHDLSRRVGP